jgi:hypothetical protein
MNLEETLKDKSLFFMFSAALMMVTKSSRVLADSGANPEAIKLINNAVELISRQLDKAAVQLETELQAMKETDCLLTNLGIPKREPPSRENKQKK